MQINLILENDIHVLLVSISFSWRENIIFPFRTFHGTLETVPFSPTTGRNRNSHRIWLSLRYRSREFSSFPTRDKTERERELNAKEIIVWWLTAVWYAFSDALASDCCLMMLYTAFGKFQTISLSLFAEERVPRQFLVLRIIYILAFERSQCVRSVTIWWK